MKLKNTASETKDSRTTNTAGDRPKKPQARRNETSRPLPEELTRLQYHACELASDVIVNGANETDVKMLIKGLLRHEYRRLFPNDDKHTTTSSPHEHSERFASEWYGDLVRHWPEMKPASSDSAMPTTVTEMARQNVRRHLRSVFDRFMGRADFENARFLGDVLETAISENGDLPQAFAQEIGASFTYLKVPIAHRDRVQEFADLLEGVKRPQ